MSGNRANRDEQALVPLRRQLPFSRQYTDDRPQRQAGMLILAILLVGILAWCLTAPIAGGVHTTTIITIDLERETVTHPYGGTVDELMIGDGDPADRGQVLLQLDAGAIESQIDRIQRERLATLALQSRLQAAQRTAVPESADGEPAEAAHPRQMELLSAKTAGLEQQLRAQTRLREFYAAERAEISASEPTTGDRHRQLADLDRRLAEQDALLADLATRITTARLDLLAAESDERARRQAQRQLHRAALDDALQRLQQLDGQRRALDDALRATIIRAPLAGRVELAPGIGRAAVIRAGAPVFSILPATGGLVATATIPAVTARYVETGYRASVRLHAGENSARMRLAGEVSRVMPGADGTDRRITIRIPAPDRTDIDSLIRSHPAEIFFDSAERTVAQRLLDSLNGR